jgi:small ligand-binding sensory domain FIST
VTAAGSGLSVSRDPVEATLEACLTAMDRSGADRADLAVVFTTSPAFGAVHEMLHAVRRVTGAPAVVGASGVGVLSDRMEVESVEAGGAPGPHDAAVAVLAVRSDALRFGPFLVDETEGLGAAAGRLAGARLAESGASALIVLPDPMGLEPPSLLAAIAESAGAAPVLGGVASGLPLFELCNTQAASGALVGLTVAGPAPLVGVAQGCAPIGEPFVITRGEGMTVTEIAGRPALEVLAEAVASVEGGVPRVRQAGIFAGLAMDPAKSPLGRGDFLVRNLIGVDRATGSVGVAEPVRVGQTIQFQLRDARAAADDLRATLAGLRRALDGRRPGFGLYFDCAGRGEGLFGVGDHDIGMIREMLGEFPLAGFFGNGEFAPVGRRNHFHNYTGVLLIFPADGAASQRTPA